MDAIDRERDAKADEMRATWSANEAAETFRALVEHAVAETENAPAPQG
jgi:hypothetical protein